MTDIYSSNCPGLLYGLSLNQLLLLHIRLCTLLPVLLLLFKDNTLKCIPLKPKAHGKEMTVLFF